MHAIRWFPLLNKKLKKCGSPPTPRDSGSCLSAHKLLSEDFDHVKNELTLYQLAAFAWMNQISLGERIGGLQIPPKMHASVFLVLRVSKRRGRLISGDPACPAHVRVHSAPASRGSQDAGQRTRHALHHGRPQATASARAQ